MTRPSRRRFLRQTGGFAALAAAIGAPRTLLGTQAQAVRVRAVDAYPIYINQRSDGLLDAPTFSGDDDPRRWRFGGPFEQLPSAIIAIIKTDQGITGFGMGAGGSVVVEIIDGHLKHLLMGANALNVEQLWDQMYSSAVLYGRRGVFAMALSAVDNALWDIVGKHAGTPVHELLGQVDPGVGRPPSASARTFSARNRIPIYQTGGDVAEGKAKGVRHFKRSLPIGPHTSAAEMTQRIDSVLAARDAMGPAGNLMTDCVSRNGTVEWAVDLAERLRPANLYFMEELLSPDNVFGYAELVRRIGGGGPGWTKVACGEHEYTEHGFDVLIRLNSAEILQPDITWCGGTTAGRRIARLVDAAGLEIIPHRGGSSWGFPIALTSPSCTMAESFPAGSTILDAMSCTVENGEVIAPTGAGFGTTLTEALVLEHRLKEN